MPVISNFGCEFQLRPVNFFNHLASIDIAESDDFEACIPQQGSSLFDYTRNGQGANDAFAKEAFTSSGRLPQPKAFEVDAAGK